MKPFEYIGWRDEMLAAYETCYIHAGLNPAFTYRFKGADAMRLTARSRVILSRTHSIAKRDGL